MSLARHSWHTCRGLTRGPVLERWMQADVCGPETQVISVTSFVPIGTCMTPDMHDTGIHSKLLTFTAAHLYSSTSHSWTQSRSEVCSVHCQRTSAILNGPKHLFRAAATALMPLRHAHSTLAS